jgi:hypothetical protein
MKPGVMRKVIFLTCEEHEDEYLDEIFANEAIDSYTMPIMGFSVGCSVEDCDKIAVRRIVARYSVA